MWPFAFLECSRQLIRRLKSLNIVHRDLKPDNIFISVGPDGVNNVKIGDFGLASKGLIASDKAHSHPSVLDQEDMTRSVGTSVYVAPEVKSGGSGSYTSKVDVSTYVLLPSLLGDLLPTFGLVLCAARCASHGQPSFAVLLLPVSKVQRHNYQSRFLSVLWQTECADQSPGADILSSQIGQID